MQRTVRVSSPLNKAKSHRVQGFLLEYNRCVNYFIRRLWFRQTITSRFLSKEHASAARSKFALTARLIQCAGKQALQIVKSQRKNSKRKRRMPRFTAMEADLDNRFWEITGQNNSFEWVRIQSGFRFFLPYKRTKMWNKWVNRGFQLSKSIRLAIKDNRLYIDFIFEKEAPPPKTEGSIEGADLGYVNTAVCTNGQTVGGHINEEIKKYGHRRKQTHRTITNIMFHELKKLDLTGIKVLTLEKLKRVKNKKRGMFSRAQNRRMSHWLYAKAVQWLGQRCEEQGVELRFVSPWKTSQYCRHCGNWDRRNRRGEVFRCVVCGHEEHADMNAAQNIKLLGLAGVYSLRSLQSGVTG